MLLGSTFGLGATPNLAEAYPFLMNNYMRKLIDQRFGRMKTIGRLRKLRHRGSPLIRGSPPSPRRGTTSRGCDACSHL